MPWSWNFIQKEDTRNSKVCFLCTSVHHLLFLVLLYPVSVILNKFCSQSSKAHLFAFPNRLVPRNRPLSRNAETKDLARVTSHPVQGWTRKNKAFCSPGTQICRRVIKVYWWIRLSSCPGYDKPKGSFLLRSWVLLQRSKVSKVKTTDQGRPHACFRIRVTIDVFMLALLVL